VCVGGGARNDDLSPKLQVQFVHRESVNFREYRVESKGVPTLHSSKSTEKSSHRQLLYTKRIQANCTDCNYSR
jgi:hypothetical protein